MKTRAFKIVIIALFVILVVVAGIWILGKKGPSLDVDVSNVDVEIQLLRFDQDLFAEYNSLEEHVSSMEKKYPDFFMLFTQQLIHIGHSGDQNFYTYLETFMQDFSVAQAHDAVNEEYSDMEDVEYELEEAAKHLKYYYPEKDFPQIVFFIAGFNHSVVTTENIIGVGLDKYLGADCKLYEMMQVPRYASQNMNRSMIPVDCMTAWFNMEYPNTDTTEYLVYQMIYEGQRMYFLDAMMPNVPDAVKMGYTDMQLAYCKQFETEMWTYFVSEKLLFSTDHLTQRKFIGDAPFTSAFGNESPARAAVWIGWQIVKSWADENNLTVQEVVEETDFQKILNQSYYEPK